MSTPDTNTDAQSDATRIAELVQQNAALTEQNAALAEQVKLVTEQVAELTRQLGKNSSNSHKPPSSDGVGRRKSTRKPKRRSGRKRGGQPGHKGSKRKMLEAELLDHVVNIFPEVCEFCQEKPLQVISHLPYRHQVVDLLKENGGRTVTEYRCYAVDCQCGQRVPAPIDQVPQYAFGPRLSAVVCLLSGAYQMSRRQVRVALNELYGIEISLGSVSNIEGRMSCALETASDEAMTHVEGSAVKHADETSFLRDSQRCSAWVFANALVSVYRIVDDGKRISLRAKFRKVKGILVSDRASVFLYWPMFCRQICWSHLLRTFTDYSERDGPAGEIGKELIEYCELVFHYWREHRAGNLADADYKLWISTIAEHMKPCLQQAAGANLKYVSGSCENLLAHWDAMWTFVENTAVDPTNNHAERELRRLVLWRKRSFGSQSERGDRFVERILTVTQTMRKKAGDTLGFLQRSFLAHITAAPAPSLLVS